MSKSEIRERERRNAPLAAAAAGVSLLLYLVSRFIEGSVSSSGGDALQVQQFHDHSGTLLLASLVSAIGFACLALPLLYLFRAAQARLGDRVRAGFVAFVILGPVLLGAQALVGWVVFSNAASDAVDQISAEETVPYDQLINQAVHSSDTVDHVTVYTDNAEAETFELQSSDGKFVKGQLPKTPTDTILALAKQQGVPVEAKLKPKDEKATAKSSLTVTDFVNQLTDQPATVKAVATSATGDASTILVDTGGNWSSVSVPATPADAALAILHAKSIDATIDSSGAAGDDQATFVIDNSSGRSVAITLTYAGLLSMAVGVFYTSIQAMRAGLLARFAGSLGAGLGAALVLAPPLALPGTMLWAGFLALLFIGRWPGPRPPAWEAAEAMPWPKPGEAPQRPSTDKPPEIEGTAEEILGTDLPESNGSGGNGSSGAQRRKRKRRD